MSNRNRIAWRWVAVVSLLAVLPGCARNGPPPEVVEFVDVEQYVGLWYEIASNPVFFNADLVDVTAEYGLLDDGRVSVTNRGRRGDSDGPETSIEGTARVVDPVTNAKLSVSFANNIFSLFFPGQYWIVLLDDVDYQYAVVTDSFQMTLFILYREPDMPLELYEQLLDELEAKNVNTSLLRVTGGIAD